MLARKKIERARKPRESASATNKLIGELALRTLLSMATMLAPPAMVGILKEYIEELEEREATDLQSAEDYASEIGEFIEAREPAEEEE